MGICREIIIEGPTSPFCTFVYFYERNLFIFKTENMFGVWPLRAHDLIAPSYFKILLFLSIIGDKNDIIIIKCYFIKYGVY